MSLSLYPLIKQLGVGGFGTTHLATNTLLPTRPHCVVKQLIPSSNEPELQQLIQERFKQEAIVLENLGKGSNGMIPMLYHYFVEQGEFYLVQEYIEGQSLTDQVATDGVFTEAQVRQFLNDILPTLTYIHAKSIIHRDIKPDNIMVRQSDNKPVLIDFGAVKEIMTTIINTELNTARSIVIGTPGFIPIEQMAGRPVFASDIYALGLTVIYLLTGKLPTEIETDPRTSNINWQAYALNVSTQLAAVINKSVESLPRDRYKNVMELSQALNTPLINNALATTIISKNSNHPIGVAYSPRQGKSSNLQLPKPQTSFLGVLFLSSIVMGGGLALGRIFASDNPTKNNYTQQENNIGKIDLSSSANSPKKNIVRSSSNSRKKNIIQSSSNKSNPTITPSPSNNLDNNSPVSTENRPNPDAAIVDHYQLIQNKQLDPAWNNLSSNFKSSNTEGFQEYQKWWNSVNNIDLRDVKTLKMSSSQSVVKAYISYQLANGKVMNDENKYMYLIWDEASAKWLIDSKSNNYSGDSRFGKANATRTINTSISSNTTIGTEIVQDYYSKINSKNYSAAWDTLASELQNNKTSNPNGYDSYLDWWANQVDSVDVRGTRLVSQTEREMVVDADIKYIMRAGRGRVSPKTVRYFFIKDSNNNWVIQSNNLI
jgi:serine/threonine protein kinase, bacterial